MTTIEEARAGTGGDRRGDRVALGPALALVALVAVVGALVGLPARATYGARTSADEPQYLLTATSLADDGDLDIADEVATAAYLDYHEVPIDRQAAIRADGRRISPHDPLLPLLLAGPMALGGWAVAKAALALVAGATAALTGWAAVRRLDLPVLSAMTVTGLAFAAMPLAPYGTQVYPEMPAAFALMVAAVAVSSPLLGDVAAGSARVGAASSGGRILGRGRAVGQGRAIVVALAAIVALPWLAAKYIPMAAVAGLALVLRLRSSPRILAAVGATAALAGAIYLLAHQELYGGWTVYATGDHFVESGQFSVVGTDVDLLGRSRRLTGLLVDRTFGLGPWAPLWFLVPLGVGRAIAGATSARPEANRPRPSRTQLVMTRMTLALLTTTWLTASFVALTMHGWWVPGRQLVVGLPLGVLLIATWVDDSTRRFRIAIGLGMVGLVNWVWLAVESSTGRRTLIVDFADTLAPGFRALSPLLPDGIRSQPVDDIVLGLWSLVIVALIVRGARDGANRSTSDRAWRPAEASPSSVMVRR